MKRIISVLLVFVLTLSSFQAFADTTAWFGAGDNYCKVNISRDLMSSKKYKTAKLKISTYDIFGKEFKGKIYVKLTDGNGNYIGTYKKNGGDTIKLGNDHSSYRVYISERFDLINAGRCAIWRVWKNKDCTIY